MSLRDLVAQDLTDVLNDGDLSEAATLASSTGTPFDLYVVLSAGTQAEPAAAVGSLSLPTVTHQARGLESVIRAGFVDTTGLDRLPGEGDRLTVRGEEYAVLNARPTFGGGVLMSLLRQQVGALGGAWRPR